MILKIDVNKLIEIIGKEGVSFFGVCSDRKIRKIEEALIKNINKWLSGEPEPPDESEPVVTNLDEAIEKWGRNFTLNYYIIGKMDEANLINNHPTFWVYDSYVKLCEGQNITPELNKITFSREVCKHLGYWIEDVTRKQHKYRVFRKLPKRNKSTSNKDKSSYKST